MIAAKLLAVKPLLWIAGGLLVVAGGLAIALQVAWADEAAAEARLGAAQSELATRTTERDAFGARVEDLALANAAWGNTVDVLQAELKRAQHDAREIDRQAQAAIAAAQAAATDADRTLERFVAQFSTESRRPACAQALTQLEAACPALSEY